MANLEAFIKELSAPIMKVTENYKRFFEVTSDVGEMLAASGVVLRVFEDSEVVELFNTYSTAAGEFIGRPLKKKELNLVIARSLDEWAEALLPKIRDYDKRNMEVCDSLMRKAVKFELSESYVADVVKHSPRVSPPYIFTSLPSDLSFIFDMQGSTHGRTVSVDLSGVDRQTFAYHMLFGKEISATPSDVGAQLSSLQLGMLKHFLAHEASHGYLDGLNLAHYGAVQKLRSFSVELYGMISDLGRSLYGIIAEAGVKFEKGTAPLESVVLRAFMITELALHDGGVSGLLTADDLRPLPRKVREFVAGHSELVQRIIVLGALNEGAAEFVADKVLIADADNATYVKFLYRVRRGSTAETSGGYESNLVAVGAPFVERVYGVYGQNAFGLLVDNTPTLDELRNPEKYLARVA